jgi:hypothetical protein
MTVQKNGCLVNQILIRRSVIRLSGKSDAKANYRNSVAGGMHCPARIVPVDGFGRSGARLTGGADMPLSEKPDSSPVNGDIAFNLGIARVNRIEVVCLHSRHNVIRLCTNSSCLIFRTNQEGGSGEDAYGLLILFYIRWLF